MILSYRKLKVNKVIYHELNFTRKTKKIVFFFILTQIPIDKNPFLWYSYKAVIKQITYAEISTVLTRKVAELITFEVAKAREFFVYLANASFFLNFG